MRSALLSEGLEYALIVAGFLISTGVIFRILSGLTRPRLSLSLRNELNKNEDFVEYRLLLQNSRISAVRSPVTLKLLGVNQGDIRDGIVQGTTLRAGILVLHGPLTVKSVFPDVEFKDDGLELHFRSGIRDSTTLQVILRLRTDLALRRIELVSFGPNAIHNEYVVDSVEDTISKMHSSTLQWFSDWVSKPKIGLPVASCVAFFATIGTLGKISRDISWELMWAPYSRSIIVVVLICLLVLTLAFAVATKPPRPNIATGYIEQSLPRSCSSWSAKLMGWNSR